MGAVAAASRVCRLININSSASGYVGWCGGYPVQERASGWLAGWLAEEQNDTAVLVVVVVVVCQSVVTVVVYAKVIRLFT